jgi:16S rRNA U1498 N3-methylase RsmE
VVAVGPEGGFDDDELRDFGSAPRLAVGPFVLRAETAAIAAAAGLAGRRTISPRLDDRRE